MSGIELSGRSTYLTTLFYDLFNEILDCEMMVMHFIEKGGVGVLWQNFVNTVQSNVSVER